MTKQETIMEKKTFKGKLHVGLFQEDLAFCAHVDNDCRLIFDRLHISARAYSELYKAMGQPGGKSEWVSVYGTDNEGVQFKSDRMDVSVIGFTNDEHHVQLEAAEAEVVFPRPSGYTPTTATYQIFLRGFKGFKHHVVPWEEGSVLVQGDSKASSPDEVSGLIQVSCPSNLVEKDWFSRAEALADFVWRGIQFGHGGRLHVPLVRVGQHNTVTHTFYRGRGRKGFLPSIHFLDQREFIETLVGRFSSPEPFPDSIWNVAGWFMSDSTIDEVRFLALMTAIEMVLDSLVPGAASTLLAKEKFKAVAMALTDTLGEFDLEEHEFSVLRENIKGINRAPLSKKLSAVIGRYQLPTDIYDDSTLRRLNKQRVSIVHKGKPVPDDDLFECILLAREIISWIIFAELGYRGRFESYANGHSRKSLPS